MSKEKQKLHLAEEYARRVRSGEILACEYVRLAVGRYYRDLDMALDRGWFFDRREAIRAIHFIECLKHTKGKWAGSRFRLEPWQQFVVWNIFGWKHADRTRRFRYTYIEIARKNGKTALAAGIALYMLLPMGSRVRRSIPLQRSKTRRRSASRMPWLLSRLPI